MHSSKIGTVSVYPFALTEQGPRYLALLRAEEIDRLSGTWQAVHGSVDEGETALQAAIRELTEETGLKALAFWQLDYVETFYVPDKDVIEMVPCFAAQLEGNVSISHEHNDFQWLSIEQAKDTFIWRNQRMAVQELHDSIAMKLEKGLPLNPCAAINPKYYR